MPFQAFAEEHRPEHREEADASDGVVDAQRCKGHAGQGEDEAVGNEAIAAQGEDQLAATPLRRGEPQREEQRKHEDLRVPQQAQHHSCAVGELHQVRTQVGDMAARSELKYCADEPAGHHGPARQAEELAATPPGQQQESQAERQRDTVVCEAAEDTHQEHQRVGNLEILAADARVLRQEEGNDALRPQLQDCRLVACHEHRCTGRKQQDERGGEEQLKTCAVGADETCHEPHQQREHRRRGRHDDAWIPHVNPRLRQHRQHEAYKEKYEQIRECSHTFSGTKIRKSLKFWV